MDRARSSSPRPVVVQPAPAPAVAELELHQQHHQQQQYYAAQQQQQQQHFQHQQTPPQAYYQPQQTQQPMQQQYLQPDQYPAALDAPYMAPSGPSPRSGSERTPREIMSSDQITDISCLAPLSSLFIKQRVEMVEVLTGFETENKYSIYHPHSKHAFLFAAEESSCAARHFLGAARPFQLFIVSKRSSNVIMRLQRPYRCCLSMLNVFDHADTLLGHVSQRAACGHREFHLQSPSREHLYTLFGPCCSPWTFQLRLPNSDEQVGQIRKKWGGLAKEMFTDADNFGCEFKRDMPVQHKALLLAAVFLIDFVYFETSQSQQQRGVFVG